jgi:hypothetical protein
MAKVLVIVAALVVYWRLIAFWMVMPNVSLTQILRGTRTIRVTEIPQGFVLRSETDRRGIHPYIVYGMRQVYQGDIDSVSPSLRQITATYHGTPPPETRYEYSLYVTTRVVLNPNFVPHVVYDCDRGILYSPNYPGEWVIASPSFRRQMRELQGQKSIFEREVQESK